MHYHRFSIMQKQMLFRKHSYHFSWIYIRFVLWMGLCCMSSCGLLPPPPSSQQDIEHVLASYPSATHLSRIVGTDSLGNTLITYTFTTMDSRTAILTFYEQQLKPLGFEPSEQAKYRKKDATFLRGGCPVYGTDMIVDQVQHQVIIKFTISLCM